MKIRSLLATAGLLSVLGSFAHAAEDPFANVVETRHGLMMQMAADMTKMGAMVKGDVAFDAAMSGKAAANVAAIASVLSMDQFPAGSETGAAADSFAKVELWADGGKDYLAKVADLNAAAAALQPLAVADVNSLKTGMGGVGKACGACHSSYRLTQN